MTWNVVSCCEGIHKLEVSSSSSSSPPPPRSRYRAFTACSDSESNFWTYESTRIFGRTPWTGDQPDPTPIPTHGTTQHRKPQTHTSMHLLGFEPTIPVFEQLKTVHALQTARPLGPVIRSVWKRNIQKNVWI